MRRNRAAVGNRAITMPFVKGKSGNPSGRPAVSPAMRKARTALEDKATPRAVEVAIELLDCDDDKVRATVALGLIKAGLGEHTRAAVDDDGKTVGAVDVESVADRARALIEARRLVGEKK